MKYLNAKQIQDVSFPDAPVEHFVATQDNKLVSFISDAFVGTSPTGKWFDDSKVEINFSDVQVLEEDSNEVSAYAHEYALREICEFILTDKTLIMRGFSIGPGLWTEFTFTNPIIKIGYDEGCQNSE